MLRSADHLRGQPDDSDDRYDRDELSTELAEQVLGALFELLRGFQAADASAHGELLGACTHHDPEHVYDGLLTVLLRLVFLLYAEARGHLPAEPTLSGNHAVAGVADLFERLREDAARDGDAMEQRHGAWARLLTRFRQLPARSGQLFDPAAYPFLEGRARDSTFTPGERLDPPRVSDGAIFRVLRGLLVHDGERVSYRALDIEHLGSVYASMMGYAVERANGPSIALGKQQVVVDLAELLAQPPECRAKWLKDRAGLEVSGSTQRNVETATRPDDVVTAMRRRVSRHPPTMLAKGTLVLQPSEARRRTGSHYTPRSLTEPIVRTTLQPVLDELGPAPTEAQVLGLKICDPAMGCGAFLVEACLQLAEVLVDAWRVHGTNRTNHTNGTMSTDEAPLLHARRLVAEHCLYGVDKNPFAVNLAKLSLWLATTPARQRPLTFLDHALKCGDSLVGLTRQQIVEFCWADAAVHGQPRRQALQLTVEDARLQGDAVIAAFFAEHKPKAREQRRAQLWDVVQRWHGGDGRAREQLVGAVAQLRENQRVVPFHWELEFPDVFGEGFHAFIGNPPFFWGNRISRWFGDAYRDWLLTAYADTNGNTDLAAYFLRKCYAQTRPRGVTGLVTTNSIAESDTRSAGLDHIVRTGGTIYAARRDEPWPGHASVRVAHVFIRRGKHAGPVVLDGNDVERIGTDLREQRSSWSAVKLSDRHRQSFKGVDFGGTGFLLTAAQRAAIIGRRPAEEAFIWPVLNASTFTSSPSLQPHESIINLTGLSQSEAERRAPECMKIVRALVLPKRMQDKRKTRRERWWIYNEACIGLYAAISGLPRVLVNPVVAKYISFGFCHPRTVFTNALNVFPFSTPSSLCLLQSRIHEVWALTHSSSLRSDPRYNPTDCFETFPFPMNWDDDPAMATAGQAYDEHRAALMIRNDEGLTKTYNRFHDPDEGAPDIIELRELHAAMDRAVLAAYGWHDLAKRATCEFQLEHEARGHDGRTRKTNEPWRYKWPRDVHDELLARLLELNQQTGATWGMQQP